MAGEILSRRADNRKRGGRTMPDDKWRDLDDEALEHLLVERWLYRGMTLGVILFAAVAATYLGARSLSTLTDRVTVGLLIAVALSAAAVGFSMRQEDIRIHHELRRRRGGGSKP
jgi:hypothetical protein